ncbi:MAG: (d)CMP kinase [Candidatus Omnitrophica bacterium]|nr:(d)CMP kinase [Candidatus Omnitrophota bacterium]
MIIAIDGPAGAGKSTIAKQIAKKLTFLYIDTGAMYRALTLKAIEQNLDISDTKRLTQLAANSAIDLINNPDGSLKVLLDGRDVTRLIREPRITKLVSDIAKVKEVRQILVKLQRELGQKNNAVLDGRDIGTVVFPGADKKFYLDAQAKERAKRRYKELLESGQIITLQEVEQDVLNRDRIDSTREFAPLKKADDAVYIDTTNMSIEQVVNEVSKHLK